MEEKKIYCGNCGKALPVGTKFCPACGTALPNYVQNMAEEMNSGDAHPEMEQETGDQGSRRLPPWLKWVILAAAIVVAAIIVIAVVVSPGKIKLNKYIVFEENGVDGYGTLNCYFDEAAFEMDYGSKIEFSESGYAFLFDLSTPAETFCDMCVDWELVYPTGKENGSLSNGDKVELKWECDDAAAKSYFNEKMKYSDMSYTVKDLTDTENTDVFDYIEMVYEGADPVGTAYVRVTSEGEALGLTAYDFQLSESEGLHNGDTITVTVNEDSLKNLEREYAIAPSETEKEYTVEGLAKYITSIADIPEEMRTSIQNVSDTVIRETEAGGYSEGVSINNLTFDGLYLVYEDPNGWLQSYSTSLYAVYTVTLRDTIDASNDNFTYYTYVEFKDPLLDADGTGILDLNDYSICSNRDSYESSSGQHWALCSYHGYNTLNELLNAIGSTNFMHDTDITGDAAGTNNVTANTGDAGEDADTSEEAEDAAPVTDNEDGQETASAENTGNSDYLCSYSSDRLVTKSDVDSIRSAGNYGTLPAGESLEQMIVNEIYARHGYRFTNQDVQAYFDKKDWYKAIGTYNDDMDAVHDQFSSIEQDNVDYLATLF